MRPEPEFRLVIDQLLGIISQSLDQTNTLPELNKLQYALNMVRQAEDFLAQDQRDACWLRLVGALDFLRMTPGTGREITNIRKQVNSLIDS